MKTKPIAALDFDGVICHSARETAVSAWRAGRGIWPEWRAPMPPESIVERFVEVRPYLETGYQAIIMMRMVVDGLDDVAFREALSDWCDRWMSRLGMTRAALVERFGAARDDWIASDEQGWLAFHDFYPGVIERLKAILPRMDVHILTTKQERFVRLLLMSVGVSISGECIFGLESGRKKEDILEAFVRADIDRPVHFAEDRAGTLRRVLKRSALDSVHLYYAAWGYGTSQDRSWAAEHPRVTVWTLADCLSFD